MGAPWQGARRNRPRAQQLQSTRPTGGSVAHTRSSQGVSGRESGPRRAVGDDREGDAPPRQRRDRRRLEAIPNAARAAPTPIELEPSLPGTLQPQLPCSAGAAIPPPPSPPAP